MAGTMDNRRFFFGQLFSSIYLIFLGRYSEKKKEVFKGHFSGPPITDKDAMTFYVDCFTPEDA